MRWLNAIAWAANFVGMASGLYVLFVAIDRNNQGEYINEFGAFDFGYALQMFIAWFLASAITTATVLSTVFLLARWLLNKLIALSSSSRVQGPPNK
jgi:hypothetical protein